jgi:hypothetical protein
MSDELTDRESEYDEIHAPQPQGEQANTKGKYKTE